MENAKVGRFFGRQCIRRHAVVRIAQTLLESRVGCCRAPAPCS